MSTYQLFSDACLDIAGELTSEITPVEVIPMQVEIGGRNYTYGPKGDITTEQFYKIQEEGNFATTSQINPTVYRQYFEPVLREGKDVLYLCFSSGLSGTIQAANLCMEDLRQEYPERKIICVDTLCAAVGQGLFVVEAARKYKEGLNIDEMVEWANENRLKACHWFTVDTFEHLRHGGRVSAVSATLGTTLNIKPLLNVDEEGRLQVKEKPRGSKKAMQALINRIQQGWTPEISKTVIIGHGDNLEAAEKLKQLVAQCCPDADIYIEGIGPIIGAHTGPGMLAVVYWGSNR